jgi:uncharacterized membrane protein
MEHSSSSRESWWGRALLAVLGLAWLAALVALPWAPARIVTHWGLNGAPDGSMGRVSGLLLLPVVATLVSALLYVVPHIDPLRRNYAAFLGVYHAIQLGTALFLTVIELLLIAAALGWAVAVPRVSTVLVGLLFVGLGSVMGKLQPNWFVGIRTPWTLASPEVWIRTHRVGRWVMTGAGAAILLAGLLLPPADAKPVILVGALGLVGFSFGYSYWCWYQIQRRGEEPSG